MAKAKAEKVMVRRHALVTRIAHWINAVALLLLLMSGLQIFNAHPALYWGNTSTFASPWAAAVAVERDGKTAGVIYVGDYEVRTTGVLGWSGPPGAQEPRGFPAWATIPSHRDLATGRRWHFFFAWLFVINGAIFLATSLVGGHVRRDLLPRRSELSPRHLWREVAAHARLRFPKGEAARRYNALQKLTYLLVIFVLLPAMVATGLSMSPGINAAWPWLAEVFGGRQSARTIHFLTAFSLVAFVVVHLIMVVASGTWNNVRSMITGRYAIDQEAQP